MLKCDELGGKVPAAHLGPQAAEGGSLEVELECCHLLSEGKLETKT